MKSSGMDFFPPTWPERSQSMSDIAAPSKTLFRYCRMLSGWTSTTPHTTEERCRFQMIAWIRSTPAICWSTSPISGRPFGIGTGSSDPAALSCAWSRTSSCMRKSAPCLRCGMPTTSVSTRRPHCSASSKRHCGRTPTCDCGRTGGSAPNRASSKPRPTTPASTSACARCSPTRTSPSSSASMRA